MKTTAFLKMLLCLLCALVCCMVVQADGEPGFRIQYVHLQESPTAQVMKVYFSLTDGNNAPLQNPSFVGVNLSLDSSVMIPYEEIVPAEDDLYLTLVLDTSRSMHAHGDVLKQAVVDAVMQLPENTHVSVVTFNNSDNITTIVPFTSDRESVSAAVRAINRFDDDTCLYDAAHHAIRSFHYENASVRRAVVLFTDGRDETANSNRCSTHTIDEVIDAAVDYTLPVPIFTVGVYAAAVDDINTQQSLDALEYIAENTGGVMYSGTKDAIPQLFRQVVGHISNQWVLVAPICVTTGQHLVELGLQLASYHVELRDAQTFNATTSCYVQASVPTEIPEDLQIAIVGINYAGGDGPITFEILPSHTQITPAVYEVRVRDGAGPLQLYYQMFSEPYGAFYLSELSSLPASIILDVFAKDNLGNILAQASSQPLSLTVATAPTMAPLTIAIVSKVYDDAAQRISFVVELSHTQIVPNEYVVRVTDSNGFELHSFDTREPNISFSITELRELPSDGVLFITVVARDADNRPLAEAVTDAHLNSVIGSTEPVGVYINNVAPMNLDGQDRLRIDYTVMGANVVDRIDIIKVDVDTRVQTAFAINPPFNSPFDIPVDNHAAEYEITAIAHSSTGVTMDPSIYTLAYQPAASLALDIYMLPESRVFEITLDGRNMDSVAAYEVNILRESGTTVLATPLRYDATQITDNRLGDVEIYTLGHSLGFVDGETLFARVRAYDSNGQQLVETVKPFQFTHASTVANPSELWKKLAAIVIVVLGAIALIAVIWRRAHGQPAPQQPPPSIGDRTLPNREGLRGLPQPVGSIPENAADLNVKCFSVSDQKWIDEITMSYPGADELYVGRIFANTDKVRGAAYLYAGDSKDISRTHLKIKYNADNNAYTVEILGGQTIMLDSNHQRIREVKQGEIFHVNNPISLQLGSSVYVEISEIIGTIVLNPDNFDFPVDDSPPLPRKPLTGVTRIPDDASPLQIISLNAEWQEISQKVMGIRTPVELYIGRTEDVENQQRGAAFWGIDIPGVAPTHLRVVYDRETRDYIIDVLEQVNWVDENKTSVRTYKNGERIPLHANKQIILQLGSDVYVKFIPSNLTLQFNYGMA